MSFKCAVGDIVASGQLCWSVYRACREAAGNYKDVTGELETLHINLKNLADEAENPKSLLNRRKAAMRDEFNHILDNVRAALKDLQEMVLKYRSLGTMEKRTWDRLRFGLKELNTTRQKLMFHTAQIELFLSNVMMDAIGRIESVLEDLVREIRSGRRAPTILSIGQGGDEAVVGWTQLANDLSECGIPLPDIERHRDDIEEYLSQLTSDLDLNSIASPPGFDADDDALEPPVGLVPEDNWDSISQRMASDGDPPSPQANLQKLGVLSTIVESAKSDSGQLLIPSHTSEEPFIDRDEPLVEDLEAKIAACQQKWKSDAEENERLRQQLQNTATENELLKATSTYNSREAKSLPTSPTPIRYSPKDSYTEVFHAHEKKPPSDRIVTTDSGERLLAAGATWNYISQHPLYKRGLVDVGDVSDMLKLVARCDGAGPVFEERDIMLAIERSVRADSGDLM